VSETKPKYWSKLIAEPQASGQKVRPFCRQRGIGNGPVNTGIYAEARGLGYVPKTFQRT